MSLSSGWLFASSVTDWPLGFVLLIKLKQQKSLDGGSRWVVLWEMAEGGDWIFVTSQTCPHPVLYLHYWFILTDQKIYTCPRYGTGYVSGTFACNLCISLLLLLNLFSHAWTEMLCTYLLQSQCKLSIFHLKKSLQKKREHKLSQSYRKKGI